jgi:hypothetical protein
MKKSKLIAFFIVAFAAALSPVVASAQPVCAYPAQWVWRGYWSCEYPGGMYYGPPYYYPYYGYPYAFYGGFVGRAFAHGGGHFGGRGHFSGGGHVGGTGHVSGGFRGGGGGHSGGGRGGHR